MHARIFRPAKAATQSGRGRTAKWRLEFEPEAARRIDPLMGWTGSDDTMTQVVLEFDSKDAAVAYARRHKIPYRVDEPHERRLRIKSYADNFR